MAKRLKRSGLQLENRLQPSLKLECFPDETLLRVFSYLKIPELLRFSHVSTRIRNICNDKSLWKIVDLSGRKVKAEFIKAVLENDCEKLNLEFTQIVGSIKLSKTSKLTHLNLRINHREVSKSFFYEILLSCCSLQKLMLVPSPSAYSKLDAAQLPKFFSQNGQTLLVLNLNYRYCHLSTIVRTKLFQLIVTHCTKLQEFNFPDLDHDALNQLVSGLSLEIEKVNLGGEDVTDEHIETLVKRCNKITALDIGTYYGRSLLTNKTITSILNNLKSLTELDITGCPNIELKKVLELESLPKLQVLNFSRGLGQVCMNEMPGLMKKLPHLIINKKVDDNFNLVRGRIAKI